MNEKLKEFRLGKGYSLEDAAEKIGIEPCALEKIESGEAPLTGEALTALASAYGVSMDVLCGNGDVTRGADIAPDYESIPAWELWSKQLDCEYRQCYDEGKDIESLKPLFDAISALPATQEKEDMCDALYKIIQKLPTRKGYKYAEPDALEAIFALRKPYAVEQNVRNVRDSLLGGWFGRICGCLLGKPIEGVRSKELAMVCPRTGNWPITRYLDHEDFTDDIINEFRLYIFCNCYPRDMGFMPADDDTNYMLTALKVLQRFGRDFTSRNFEQIWLEVQPKGGYCTAERVAYRNFTDGIHAPESALYKNPYREWIGAQIRADVLGYINPCDPEAAADMAWRDARIAQVKNGIYGEMWVAAMLAAAYGTESIPDVIRAGLAQIPATSRLYEAVTKVLTEYEAGRSEEDTFKDIATRWNEYNQYDWCHTISNAEIVTACLLYGAGDYGRSICLAVMQGFDTDCNAATVGSVLGVLIGYEKLPREWTDRVHDTLGSTLVGEPKFSITKLAEECMKFVPEKYRQ